MNPFDCDVIHPHVGRTKWKTSISATMLIWTFFPVLFIRYPYDNVGNMIRFFYQDSNNNKGNGKKLF